MEVGKDSYDKEAETVKQANGDASAYADFSITIPEASKIVGVGQTYLGDLNHVYAEYFAMYEVHKENGELAEKEPDLKEAKNVLTQHFLLNQILKDGAFEIPKNLPFEKICNWCNGTGEKYLFNRTRKEVKCNRCEEGQVWVRCRSCKGTTRYVVNFKEGGKIDVQCRTCKDSPEEHKGEVQVKCRVCQGTQIAQIMVLDHSLKSTTPCPVCDELGFILPKESKSKPALAPDNPVLAGDLAEKLKQQIDDTEPFDKQ
jgi:hypothetical protein